MLLLLEAALGYILEALGLLQVIQGLLKPVAVESTPYSIERIATATSLTVNDLTYGNAALFTQQATNYASLVTALSGLAADIAGRQSGTSAVILPTTPPTGYGGLDATDTALAVWSYVLPDMAGAGDALADLYNTQNGTVARNGLTLPGILWQAAMSNNNFNQLSESGAFPSSLIDETTILPTDVTILAWLQRVYPYDGWTSNYRDGNAGAVHQDGSYSDVWWTCTMSQSQFLGFQGVASTVIVAPVWPGLALVTLGTPVTITLAFTIAVPLHGVIVTLTAEPSKSSFYSFDGVNSYRNLGALSFTTDDGEQEASTSLGFTSGIYTPKTMAEAAGVKVRTVGGVAGTVTPWVIT